MTEQEEPRQIPRKVRSVEIASIVLWKNPRGAPVKEWEVAELAASLEAVTKTGFKVGLLEPIGVRPLAPDDPRRAEGKAFELFFGERRYLAATLNQWTSIEAAIMEVDDETATELAAIENAHRQSMTVWAIMHVCLAERAKRRPIGEIARLVALHDGIVNDFFVVSDKVAPDLVQKLEFDPRYEILNRLRACARIPGGSDAERYERQRLWWKAEGWRRKTKGPKRAPKRHRNSTIVRAADQLEQKRTLLDPDTDQPITLTPKMARAVGNALRWAAMPGNHKKPV